MNTKTLTTLCLLLAFFGTTEIAHAAAPYVFDYYCEGFYDPGGDGDDDCDDVPTQSNIDTNKSLGGAQQCDSNTNTCPVGDPIDTGSGNVYEKAVDYLGEGPYPLSFVRFYNSLSTYTGSLGANWSHAYAARIQVTSQTSVQVIRPEQKTYTFTLTNGVWRTDGDVNATLTSAGSGGVITGFVYVSSQDATETYDASGHLLSITDRQGNTQTLTYDAQSRVASVTDPFGRKLLLGYDSQNRVASLTDPGGNTYVYAYSATNNLSSVTYPDGKILTYVYEDSALPHALTGIVDENGSRYVTWTYDDLSGLGLSSQNAGGANKVSIVFGLTGVIVTDANGNDTTHTYDSSLGQPQITAITQPCPSCNSGTSTVSFTYDANANLAGKTDATGVKTTYSYDLTRNLETSRTEAVGTPQERTITTAWHPTLRLPTQINEPNRTTTFTYDSKGNLTQRTLTADGQTRTWNYTYNANGQITQSDGPRTDVSDITSYVYDASGNLTSITDALGHSSQITAYDAHGRPLTLQDPNGLITQLSYDARGRLVSRNEGGEITRYAYDGAGQLVKTTAPSGAFIAYTYDSAHRLTQIDDEQGNKITYTLDLMGNRTQEKVYDPSGILARASSNAYDALNRLKKSIGSQQQTTQFQYDANGNLSRITDPLGNASTRAYDALNRLMLATDPNGGKVTYSYDSNDNLTQIADPRGLLTRYDHSGFAELRTLTSPDTGVTQNTYDAAANRLTSTDARGKVTRYAYDALNRLTTIQRDGGQTITLSYDSGSNGIGRLTEMTDPSGTTAWSYDSHGRLLEKTQTSAKASLKTEYAYDSLGNLVQMTYPSGAILTYSYDKGRITQAGINGTPLISAITYAAFGPVTSLSYGNGATHNRRYDQDGRLSQYTLWGDQTISLGYDNAGRITSYTDSQGQLNQTMAYDKLGRLTTSDGYYGHEAYTYDANHNRLSHTIDDETGAYTYASNSNRLLSINLSNGSKTQTIARTYDASGNTLTVGNKRFNYDDTGRLVKSGGVVYQYNGLGQRVGKQGYTFVYDEAGHLIGVYNREGVLVNETVYLGDMPVAINAMDGIRYINADQLNAPRTITDASDGLVSTWPFTPFGNKGQQFATAERFVYNLRFPGQYYDKESKLHYNGFRDYEPGTGRYMESDPVGLKGGENTYTYVGGQSINRIDPFGLWTVNIGVSGSINIPFIGPIGNGGGGFSGIVYDGTHWAWYGGGGGGVGAGAGGSLGIQFGVSNAGSVCDLRGPFISVSGSGGEGIIVGGEGYIGSGSNGQSVAGGNLFIGGGVGTPVSGTAGVTYTWVKPW